MSEFAQEAAQLREAMGLQDDAETGVAAGTAAIEGAGGAAATRQSTGRDYESEAAIHGWVPKDQFRDDPSKWVDAKTFVERGERFNKNLQKEVAQLKAQIASFEGTKKAFQKFHEEKIAEKNADIDRLVKQLRIEYTEAVRNGESEAAVDIEDRIDALKKQKQEVSALDPAASAPQIDPRDPNSHPVLREWVDDGNQWFEDYPELADFAIKLGDAMRAKGEKATGRPFLDMVAAEMRVQFPRKLGATKGATPQHLDGSGRGSGTSSASFGGHSAADLPEEDRKLMKQFIAEGWVKDEKTFLESYFSRK